VCTNWGHVVSIYTGSIGVWIDSAPSYCEHDNETSGSAKRGNFLTADSETKCSRRTQNNRLYCL